MRHLAGRQYRKGRRWARRRRRATARWIEDRRPAPVKSVCYAPHAALYFRPDGAVQACCATGYEVGWVTGEERRSLREIWDGANLRRHRETLQRGSFELGCQECELAIDGGGRPASLASHFDRWRLRVPDDFPKLIDFALSNRCNLECVMCNGELSSTIRAKREGRAPLPSAYDDAFFEELADFLPHVDRVQFKGGEPFLGPENRRVWDLMLELGVHCETVITTNGTIWNDQVERYIRQLGVELNISVDGVTPEVLDPIRVGAHCDALWENIDRFQAVCEDIGTSLTLSYCLMTTNWHELPAFLAEVDRRGVSCYVILVNQPHQYDIFRTPRRELERVLEALEPCGATLRTEPTIREWSRIVTRIRSQLEHPVELSVRVAPPALPPPPPEPPPPPLRPTPVDEQVVRSQAAAWGDAEPMRVTVVGGVISAVDVPDWAGWLNPLAWVGHHENEMGRLLREIVGSEPTVDEARSELARVGDVLVSFDRAEMPTIRTLAMPVDDAAEPTARWYVSQRHG